LCMGRRDVFPWRAPWRRSGAGLVCPPSRPPCSGSGRFHCPHDSAGSCRRPLGQLRQRRTMGPPDRPPLGNDLSLGGQSGPSSLTALSNDLRRPAVVRLTVVVFEQTAGAGASERLVPDGIWGRPIYGGVHSRTG